MNISYNYFRRGKRILFSIFVFFIIFLGMSEYVNAQTIIYNDDFTTTTNGTWGPWSTSSASYWDQRTNGGGYWQTTNDYNNNEDSYIESPNILIPSTTTGLIELIINGWHETEENSDYGYIYIYDVATGFGSATTLYSHNGNNRETLNNRTFTISNSLIGKTVRIRIRMDADNDNNVEEGWQVDDITLRNVTGCIIKGTITAAGQNFQGATVIAYSSGITHANTTSAADGTYTLEVPAWGYGSQNFQILASFDGFAFNTNVSAWNVSQYSVNTVGNLYTTTNRNIRGRVTNFVGSSMNGVLVTVSKPGTSTVWTATTNSSNPNFTISAPDNSGTVYTETPTYTGITFTPAPRTFTLTDDVSGHDYTVATGTISGNVKQSVTNLNVPNVNISVNTSPVTNTTTDANGNYTVTVPAGTWQVTASRSGFTLTPNPANNVIVSVGNNTEQNFAMNGSVVTGTISGVAGSTITTLDVSGGSTYDAQRTGNGTYVIFLPNGTNVTITPSAAGYSFIPPIYSANITSNGLTLTQNFEANTCGLIWGRVTLENGNPVQYFPVHLTGTMTKTTLTDAAGYYYFTELLRPSNSNGSGGCIIWNEPMGQPYGVNVQPYADNDNSHGETTLETNNYVRRINLILDHVESNINQYQLAISAKLAASPTVDASGVTIQLYKKTVGPSDVFPTDYVKQGADLTAPQTITGLTGSSTYIVIASKDGNTISPTVTGQGTNGFIKFMGLPGLSSSAQFLVTPVEGESPKIKGRITLAGSSPEQGLRDVVVNLTGSNSYTTATDANGNYEVAVEAGTYTITPDSTNGGGIGYNFTLTQITGVVVSTSDVTGQDFTANLSKELQISGTIYNGANKMGDVSVTLYKDGVSAGTMTTPNTGTDLGKYAFTGLAAHSKYEVQVHMAGGYSFIPNNGAAIVSPPIAVDDGYKLFNDMIVSQVQDFATGVSTGTINGTVATGPAPKLIHGVQNVTINITGPFTTSAVTNENGLYSAVVPIGSNYSITPAIDPDQGYRFGPVNYTSQTINAGAFTYDFTADTAVYSVSGMIKGITGTATINLYDITGPVLPSESNRISTTTAGNNETYTFYNTSGDPIVVKGLRTYMIVPVLTNFAFNPNNRTLTNLIGTKTDLDFTAQAALGPQLNTPSHAQECVSIRPSFTWNVPAGQTFSGYKIQVSTTSGFETADLLWEYNTTDLGASWLPTNSLANGTTYYWRVEGQAITGNNWSEVRSFTTTLGVPVLQSPGNDGIVSIRPTLTWNVVTGAKSYHVYIYSDQGCSTLVREATVSAASFSLDGDLNSGASYWWKVYARSSEYNIAANCVSQSSAVWKFTTDPGVPQLIDPFNGQVGVSTTPTLVWQAAAGAVTYTVEYSTTPNFEAGTVTTIAGLNNTILTYKITNALTIAKTYYWKVTAVGPLSNKTSEIWSFRTAAGLIVVDPLNLNFGTIVVNREKTLYVNVMNQGFTTLRVSSFTLSGANANQFSLNGGVGVLALAPGESRDIPVKFTPTAIGTFTANLVIDHNDVSSETNPVIVPLTGTSVQTMATLNLPTTLDFGTLFLMTGEVTRTFEVGNNSTVPGDNLILSDYSFDKNDSMFTMATAFPVVLTPGNSALITVRFNPKALGLQTNTLHILNSSANQPDGAIQTIAVVNQGGLIVNPLSIDYGNTTIAEPFKTQAVTIQNNTAGNITISDKNITGDVASFTFDTNVKPITLAANQTDTVVIRFMPPTVGRKNGVMHILSDADASHIMVPMTGIGGENAVVSVLPAEINFGDIRKGQTKDTTVIIKNDGSLELVITSKSFVGTDKELFSFVNDGNPITLAHGQSESVVIRITGDLPVGGKNAQLQIASNDPNHPLFSINLLANIKTTSISTVEKVEFDSVGVGYYVDSTITVRNDGNIDAFIQKVLFDGAFAADFSVVNFTAMYVEAGKTANITIRFKPLALGLRYARMIIYSDDATRPQLPVILKGYGKNVSTDIAVTDTDGKTLDDGLDFGTLVIYESKTLGLLIKNVSRYAKLRLDSIFLTALADQPFSFENWTLPVILKPGESKILNLTFNPRGLQRSYVGYINIKFSDSTALPTRGAEVATKLKGHVIFPGSKVNLPPVLVFGKVLKDQAKTVSFTITNRGEAYLKIDSLVFSGADAAEFKVASPSFPVTVDPEKELTVQVTFSPKVVGTKDAKIMIYWNDVFTSGEVSVSAEGYVTGNQTTDVTSLNVIPTVYALQQNYPNPFNPSTKIEYSVPENSFVTIQVYNSMGQLVETLMKQNQPVGTYRIDWNARNLPTGIYFYRMETSKYVAVKKMLLVK